MIALLAAATLAAAPAPVSTATPAPTSPAAAPDADATRILAEAARGGSYPILAELTDGVGARLAGSPGAAAAVRWAEAWFRKAGIPVRLQPVQVNHWIRGEERAEVLAAPGRRAQPLAVTALGNSAPTPPSGLEGEVVEVGSLEELAALGEKVKGRIVLFRHDMKASSDYGRASRLRMRGPDAAARQGAVAALVRSASTASFRLPHTGATVFQPGTAPIPAAALATEDAELLHRLLAAGPVRVRLVLGCRTAEPPLAPSANVIAEIRGAERPDEVVVVGAHLDAWDLGTGAIDDGAGVAMVMDTMRILARMPRPPRRTIRAVLFMNEELGQEGAVAYHEASLADGTRHVAAMEADSGAGRPTGVRATTGPGGLDRVRAMAAPLAPLGASSVREGGDGTDISPLAWAGVPFVGIGQETSRYFDWHHSAADTLDKVDPRELAEATAAFAWMAWSLADAAEPLPRQPVPTEAPWWKRAAP